MPIRIVLIDDQQEIHDAITALLRTKNDIQLVGQRYRGEDAVEVCRLTQPDIVLMDIVMTGMSGVEATRAVLDAVPVVRVLGLSSYSEYEYIMSLMESGAIGYIAKDAIAADLVETIRAAYYGNVVFSAEVARVLLAPPSGERANFELTSREQEVLALMGQGLTNGQIAHDLAISVPTVRFHSGNILRKMRVETRSEALVIATRHNLI